MRRFSSACLAGVSLLALTTFATLGPATAATLDEMLLKTYLENPRLQSERARLRAVDEQVPQALSGWRPLARANGGFTIDRESRDNHNMNRVDKETNRETDVFHQFDTGLTVQQSLYSGGETVADTSRAESTVRAGRSRLSGAEQDVLADMVTAYAGVIRARNVLRLSRENYERLSRYLEGTQERLRLLEVTRTDLDQAQSRVAGAIADIARAENELVAALAQYEQLVGEPAGELVPAVPLTDLPPTVAAALVLLPDNPRLQQAAYDFEAARYQVRVSEAALLPDVNLVGRLANETQPGFGIDNRNNASIGAELVVPLYQRGSEYSRVRQSKQQMIQARYALDDVERLVQREIRRSFEAWQSAERQIAALRTQTAAAARALEGTREEAIAGVRTTLDVLNAELELFAAQIRLERAIEAEINASYDLKAAVGGLDLDNLEIEGPRYDPERNYREVRNRWFGLAVEIPPGMPPLPPQR